MQSPIDVNDMCLNFVCHQELEDDLYIFPDGDFKSLVSKDVASGLGTGSWLLYLM